MKYIVSMREVHLNHVAVEAETAEEAIEKAREGDYVDEDNTEYSHCLDPECWTAEKASD